MKKYLLIPLAIFAIIVGYAFVSKAQGKSSGVPSTPSATLYADKCASCHGTGMSGAHW